MTTYSEDLGGSTTETLTPDVVNIPESYVMPELSLPARFNQVGLHSYFSRAAFMAEALRAAGEEERAVIVAWVKSLPTEQVDILALSMINVGYDVDDALRGDYANDLWTKRFVEQTLEKLSSIREMLLHRAPVPGLLDELLAASAKGAVR